VELAFLTRPVSGDRVPGIPTPTVPRAPAYERDDGGERRLVVVARRVDAKPRHLDTSIERDAFDLRAA
jgi:hypothetical protein